MSAPNGYHSDLRPNFYDDPHVLHRHTRPQSTKTKKYFDLTKDRLVLQPRSFFQHHTPVKVDSQAGATGTSIAQLPGRHLLVSPWYATSVWTMMLLFIALTLAGFILSYQARKEFRMRVKEQAKAQAVITNPTSECQIPITRKEFKSFTRKSIMVLNSNPEKFTSPYRVSTAGELMPHDFFNRPTRESVLIAEIRPPSSGFTSEDPFNELSRQLAQEGFWDRASRKSKALSVVNFTPMVSRLSRAKPNPLAMMELLAEEPESQSPSDAPRRPKPRHDPSLGVRNYQNNALRFLPPMPKLAPEPIQLHRKASGPDPSPFARTGFSDSISDEKSLSFQEKFVFQKTVPVPPPARSASLKRSTSAKPIATSVTGQELSPSPPIGLGPGQAEKTSIDLPDSLLEIISPLDDLTRAASPCALEALPPICPDDAVAQYAMTRAATPSPAPSSTTKLTRSGSVLNFVRRSVSGRVTPSLSGRDSPAPALSLSISEPRINHEEFSTKRDRSPSSPTTPLVPSALPLPPLPTDLSRKPPVFTHSIILEEEEDSASVRKGLVPTTPIATSSDETSAFGSFGVSSPTRVPPTALNGAGRGLRRMRSHTIPSIVFSAGTEGTSSDDLTSPIDESSTCSFARSTSSGSISTDRNSALIPRLTLKKRPSMSTNPNGRRRRHAQASSIMGKNDTFSSFGGSRGSGRQTSSLNRVREEHLTRNTSDPVPSLRNSDRGEQSRSAPTAAAVRRAASAQARIPLSGTMSSGGVRDSSFVP